jgi:signal transduction histidine kinase
MKLSIKSKLFLGFAFFFLVILLLGGIGAISIEQIGSESKEILKDNYKSLLFCKSMMQSLDEKEKSIPPAQEKFENNLQTQERNITEPGEKELTLDVRIYFEDIKKHFSPATASGIRQKLYQIIDINMLAIVRKNNLAQGTINKVLQYMGFIGSIAFLILFTFIINFPGYIANPIKELTAGIKQIANRNYSERLHFQSNDEFRELAEAFNSMAQKLDSYENSNLAKLVFEKKRIETIINNMKDPIIGLNEKKVILFVNHEAGKILGLTEKDLVGKYAPDVAVQNDLIRTLLIEGPTVKPLKIFADNKESYFNREILIVAGENDQDGLPVKLGSVIILKNITQFQELDLAKTNFIATISHELKTPIASIKLSSRLLEDSRIGSLNSEQKELIGNITDETERLLKITGELLDIAQVETGKIHLNFQLVKPEEIITYAIEALHFQARQKNLKLEFIASDKHLPSVLADLEKTAWIMVNLLSNAIRYSPENSEVILTITQKENFLEFSVRDHGQGIEMKYQEKVFDKFYRIPGSTSAGTGLGLAIAKEFILAQGGLIGVESEFGKGSRFFFTLPCGIS